MNEEVGFSRMGSVGASLSGGSNTAKTAESELSREARGLEQAVEFVRAVLNDLSKKLEPIMRGESPMNDGKTERPPASTQIGQEFRLRADAVNALGNRISDLIQRIEL